MVRQQFYSCTKASKADFIQGIGAWTLSWRDGKKMKAGIFKKKQKSSLKGGGHEPFGDPERT
jgi:hypothetical protein